MLGCDAMFASVPFDVDFSCVVQFWAPVDEVTVAPGPPPLVAPYVTVSVPLPARVRLEIVIVWPATESVPELAVV